MHVLISSLSCWCIWPSKQCRILLVTDMWTCISQCFWGVSTIQGTFKFFCALLVVYVVGRLSYFHVIFYYMYNMNQWMMLPQQTVLIILNKDSTYHFVLVFVHINVLKSEFSWTAEGSAVLVLISNSMMHHKPLQSITTSLFLTIVTCTPW